VTDKEKLRYFALLVAQNRLISAYERELNGPWRPPVYKRIHERIERINRLISQVGK
jgi:hypothetical protein